MYDDRIPWNSIVSNSTDRRVSSDGRFFGVGASTLYLYFGRSTSECFCRCTLDLYFKNLAGADYQGTLTLYPSKFSFISNYFLPVLGAKYKVLAGFGGSTF